MESSESHQRTPKYCKIRSAPPSKTAPETALALTAKLLVTLRFSCCLKYSCIEMSTSVWRVLCRCTCRNSDLVFDSAVGMATLIPPAIKGPNIWSDTGSSCNTLRTRVYPAAIPPIRNDANDAPRTAQQLMAEQQVSRHIYQFSACARLAVRLQLLLAP